MLVLTRKADEKIIIGKDKKITITVLRVHGDKVSLGVEADADTPIFRDELVVEPAGEHQLEPTHQG